LFPLNFSFDVAAEVEEFLSALKPGTRHVYSEA
jgi:hypothetical protein